MWQWGWRFTKHQNPPAVVATISRYVRWHADTQRIVEEDSVSEPSIFVRQPDAARKDAAFQIKSTGKAIMATQTISKRALHPLIWVAGIALILFSAVGVGAFMGWIPAAKGNSSDGITQENQTTHEVSLVPASTAASSMRHSPSTTIASTAASHNQRRCDECGVVESVRESQTKGEGSGLGAVGGGVVGGLLGNQVGGGHGKDAMTVVGAIGGAIAGNEVEKRAKSTTSYATTVRLDDGSSRVVSETSLPAWRAGDKIKVVDGVIRPNY